MEPEHRRIVLSRQCRLLGLSRRVLYYIPQGIDDYDLVLMRELDVEYTAHPFLGVRKLTVHLQTLGYVAGVKRVRRLLRTMGLMAIYETPKLKLSTPGHKIYPYLLRNLTIDRPSQVWATDITYLRLAHGFVYLTAIIDWYSRYVLSWRLSNTLDALFCIEALEEALSQFDTPSIFNSDQGSQFGSDKFTDLLISSGVAISMDGKGRWVDNRFVERLWRTVKYEEVFLHDYEDLPVAKRRLTEYFHYYNCQRPHQSLGYQTPETVYREVVQGSLESVNHVSSTPLGYAFATLTKHHIIEV